MSCWAPSFACAGGLNNAAHARSHAADRDHPIALDLSRLAFYCFSCSDYVYSPPLDSLLTSLATDARTRKRTRDAIAEIDAMPNKLSTVIKERTKLVGRDPLAGVRGMFNLGNTSAQAHTSAHKQSRELPACIPIVRPSTISGRFLVSSFCSLFRVSTGAS